MAAPEYAIIIANTTNREIVDSIIPQLEQFCLETFPDLEAKIAPLQIGETVENPVEVRISGKDYSKIFKLVNKVKNHLNTISGTKNISDNLGMRSKKIIIQVNQARALRSGITNQDIAISLQTLQSGIETTEFREDDKVIPIIFRSVTAKRQDIGKLESLNVFAQSTGQSVPLKQVANIEVVWQPAKILRRNRLKTVTVGAGLVPGITAAEVTAQLRPWLDEQSRAWGIGYSYALGGEDEASAEANKSIMDQFPIAGLIIIFLLVGQFNSLRRPVIILITIPLGLIGVVIGLLTAQSYFGFMTLLGVVSLAGIVINNAIVLLDRIRIEIVENGLTPQHAIVESAQKRMRPILLTTCTTIGGLIPLWMGGGVMWEPMAIAIIFGLLFATLLTLGVVPVLYSLFFRVSFKGYKH
ncbi:efflux RND transporter permease subunit [candidate division CSSED10-310 bacterium]|uniref:Efflux RND transporter permease subunit n=1 Tax=candidate division CSSED10-310 bacterium TaxID=2855610 RepID=A0ABV6YRP5_UNCC1